LILVLRLEMLVDERGFVSHHHDLRQLLDRFVQLTKLDTSNN